MMNKDFWNDFNLVRLNTIMLNDIVKWFTEKHKDRLMKEDGSPYDCIAILSMLLENEKVISDEHTDDAVDLINEYLHKITDEEISEEDYFVYINSWGNKNDA